MMSVTSNFTRLNIICTLVALLLISSSCSFKTAYNNLDYIIPAYINHMVDIDSELSDLVDLRTIAFLKWHREDQLPKYLDWLSQIKLELLNNKVSDIKKDRVIYFINHSSQFWTDISNKSSLEMARLLPLLNEEQIDELFENLSDNNKEFISKNISLSKKNKEQIYEERLLENIEEWTGYLTDDQLKSLKELSLGFQSLSHLRLKARLEWQRETREILTSENKLNRPRKLKSLFDRLTEKHKKLYEKINTANKEHLANIITGLFKTLKTDQHQNILSKLDYYIKTIEDLKNQI